MRARHPQATELVCRWEPSHFHEVLLGAFGRSDADSALALNDAADLEVKLRGKAPIQAQLLLTEESPLRRGGEVSEGVAHRAFDLVCEIACEQHPGDVGRNELDRCNRCGYASGRRSATWPGGKQWLIF